VVVRVMSGPTGGGFYPLGEGLAAAFGRLLPEVTFEHHPSTGAVSNAELIQAGNADVGFVFADVAYVAYVGRLERKQVFDRLRGIAVLELTPLHLVVRPGITSVRDLRGRRVAVGPPGSGTALTAEIVLRAFDIKLSDIHTEALQFDVAARRLVAGHLDAMFDTAIYPAEAVRMAASAGARLMPLTGSPIDKLRHEYPFFRAAVIPRDAYPGVTGAVHTIGVDSLLVCRRDMDEELVYQLTRRFFDALPMLSSSRNALRLMDLDQAPATPIPLHDGAARYYRERELLR
jgi:TRAP transporter TAXI family solute receptor